MTGEELFLNELNFHIRSGLSKKDLTDLINERLNQLTTRIILRCRDCKEEMNTNNNYECGCD